VSSEVWTPLKLIQWTEKHFAQKGITQPRLEAELLLAHVLGWQRIELYTRFEHAVEPEALGQFRDLVKRRAGREPRQYLIGTDNFYGLTLKLDKRVLIPRDETEHLVGEALKRVGQDESGTMVDLCTGSGAVAVAVASERKGLRVLACDVSADALEVARSNVAGLGLGAQVEVRLGDLFEAVPGELKGTVDLITANPPYVGEGEMDGLPPEVAQYEPRLALVAGTTGLEVIERIVREAGAWLKAGGHLLMEIGQGQAKAVRELVSKSMGMEMVGVVRDYGKVERVVIARREGNHG